MGVSGDGFFIHVASDGRSGEVSGSGIIDI